MAGYRLTYDFLESVENSAMAAFEATSQLYGSHVVPGGCTDVRKSKIVRTSTGFRCETCNWHLPSDPAASNRTHFKTKDNGKIPVELALRFFHVLDPQAAGYYFTCPEHLSKAYKTVSRVAGHIEKHHTKLEFENALQPSP